MSALIDDAAREWIGRAAPARRIEVTRNEIVKYSIATEQRLRKYLDGDEAPPISPCRSMTMRPPRTTG